MKLAGSSNDLLQGLNRNGILFSVDVIDVSFFPLYLMKFLMYKEKN